MEYKPDILQLAALRQSKGISLESIAEGTKISCYYLRAIENLDLDKLPAGVYRDNFLKQYARSIDEDLAEELGRKLAIAAKEAADAVMKAATTSGVTRSLKEMLAKGAAFAFLLGTGTSLVSQQTPPAQTSKDPRLSALRDFFERCSCPIAKDSDAFLVAADRHGLDWRMLPSIAYVETTGGKHQKGGNPLGWGSGKIKFGSTRQAIHHVAERLARSPIYAQKDLVGKLRTYNPANKQYAARVMEVMDQLGPKLIASR
ncbi:MAG: helix-turn-helix domain-containing protein [Acidobacteria bacterium]|nr:helix-turn-helix domain-containing protein [Acidobacteriota bacterium]